MLAFVVLTLNEAYGFYLAPLDVGKNFESDSMGCQVVFLKVVDGHLSKGFDVLLGASLKEARQHLSEWSNDPLRHSNVCLFEFGLMAYWKIRRLLFEVWPMSHLVFWVMA